MNVVHVLIVNKLLKGRNISHYNYHIIRLASRRGINPHTPIKDIKTKRIKKIFDNRFFGLIYPRLGWDHNCDCPYFLEWLKGNKKPITRKSTDDPEFFIDKDLTIDKPIYDEEFLTYVESDEFKRIVSSTMVAIG